MTVVSVESLLKPLNNEEEVVLDLGLTFDELVFFSSLESDDLVRLGTYIDFETKLTFVHRLMDTKVSLDGVNIRKNLDKLLHISVYILEHDGLGLLTEYLLKQDGGPLQACFQTVFQEKTDLMEYVSHPTALVNFLIEDNEMEFNQRVQYLKRSGFEIPNFLSCYIDANEQPSFDTNEKKFPLLLAQLDYERKLSTQNAAFFLNVWDHLERENSFLNQEVDKLKENLNQATNKLAKFERITPKSGAFFNVQTVQPPVSGIVAKSISTPSMSSNAS